MGKLSNEELKKLLSCIKRDPRVVVPPMPGYDAGVHRLGDNYVVVATDPCIGVPDEWFGWLLINYAASDVAIFGAKPEFCTVTLLGPRALKPQAFQSIMRQACTAADELGMAIVRGHTGTYDGLAEPVGVCTAYGTVTKRKLITPGNAKAGDLILCTKPLGLETIVNFSLVQKEWAQKLFGAEKQQELAKFVPMQTCVKEALQLAETDSVQAMHDATEGGFVTALNELAEASNVGFTIHWEKLPVSDEALALQKCFSLSDEQLLSMSSTGTILAAADPQAKEKVTKTLSKIGLSAYFLGEFTKSEKRVLIKSGKETVFPATANDPYSLILSGKP